MQDEGDNYELLAKKHVMITEVSSGPPTAAKNETDSKTSKSEEQQSSDENKFFVEEPFDFIFEPDHYPKTNPKSSHETTKKDEEEKDKSNQHKYAHVIRESDDGMLEYEYKSFTYDRSFYTNKLNDDLDSIYFEEFNSHLHMRAESLIRGVSLSRWPNVGFGFELATARLGSEPLVYINRIHPDSPAKLSSLRLGDVLIEIDEMLPAESFAAASDDEMLKRVNEYVGSRENLHFMVVHESQYSRLKADDEHLLKNYYFNCEDIVVVNFHKNQQQISIE